MRVISLEREEEGRSVAIKREKGLKEVLVVSPSPSSLFFPSKTPLGP